MAKKKRSNQAKGYKPPSLSEIFEPLIDGYQNIGDSLVFDPNSEYEFGKQMTVKDAKRFRKEYSDSTDVDGSGRRGTISKEYEIAPTPTVNEEEINQNTLAEAAANREEAPQQNSFMPQDNPLVAMQGDQIVFLGNEKAKLMQKFKTEDTILNNAIKEQQQVNTATDNNYVTDYQTAMRQGVDQYYGEDVLDSAGKRVKKSNVFTENELGEPMGVMSRRRRLAYDLKMQEAKIPTTEVTTEQTGTVKEKAGTPQGVVTPVEKSPMPSLFDEPIV